MTHVYTGQHRHVLIIHYMGHYVVYVSIFVFIYLHHEIL
jgi:hypothetical protein